MGLSTAEAIRHAIHTTETYYEERTMTKQKARASLLAEEVTCRLEQAMRKYTEGRKSEVAQGAETPALSGLMVQKYLYGMSDCFRLLQDVFRGSGFEFPLSHAFDTLYSYVAGIDPHWEEHMKQRWKMRPAHLCCQDQK